MVYNNKCSNQIRIILNWSIWPIRYQELETHHQMQFSVIPKTLLYFLVRGFIPLQGILSSVNSSNIVVEYVVSFPMCDRDRCSSTVKGQHFECSFSKQAGSFHLEVWQNAMFLSKLSLDLARGHKYVASSEELTHYSVRMVQCDHFAKHYTIRRP